MKEKQYFGTDGIRGRVGRSPISADFMVRLGWAAGSVLAGRGQAIVVGKDTRVSGYMLESALESGIVASGADVVLLGPLPTPGIAFLTTHLRAAAGIVISASHNPFADNGIKFFSAQGAKLSDTTEFEIEAAVAQAFSNGHESNPGKASRFEAAVQAYVEHCLASVGNALDLTGLKIVLDCANGATYKAAPLVFERLGATLTNLGVAPDGRNINAECGSTQPKLLQSTVRTQGADLGIAFDGDGDRVIMVDAAGQCVDGDRLLYILACARQAQDRLPGNTVVGTQMSNLGFEHALNRKGMQLRRAQVGDRHVHRMLCDNGWVLGGEASGHLLILDRGNTGDGIVSALQVLTAIRGNGYDLAAASAAVASYPQTMINVAAQRPADVLASPDVVTAAREVEANLGDCGRVILRPSGTEPVIRVTVEGEDPGKVDSLADRLAEAVRSAAQRPEQAIVTAAHPQGIDR